MTRNLLHLGLALLVSAPLAATGNEVASLYDRELSPSERIEALADRVRSAHQSLETLEADFTQTKESGLLLEPDRAEGRFSYAAPDRVRWDYAEPEPISLVIAERLMTTWYRDIGQAEQARVGEQSDRVLRYLGAGTSLETLDKYFTVTMHLPPDRADPVRLELDPRFERVAKRIRSLDIWLDPELFLPVRLRYVEGDGDSTEYLFRNLRPNGGIPAGRFELEIPPEVEIREIFLESRTGAR